MAITHRRSQIGNPRKARTYTPDQVEKKKEKAVRFLRDVVGDDDKADEVEDMSLDDYAEHKHLRMQNPSRQRRETRGKRRTNSGAERCRQYRDRCVPMDEFAFVGDPEKSTTYHLRLDNETHVRDAMSRFSHTRIPKQYRRKVAAEIVRAAKRYGMNTSHFEAKYLGRRNPGKEAGAEKLYERFHGKDPDEVLEFETVPEPNRDLTALGDLMELVLEDPGTEILFSGDGVVLASNAAGTQIFAIGGNQDLTGALRWVEDPSKEMIDFGPVASVTYRTRKRFDGFEALDYVHELGEEGGERPRLIYCQPKKQMYFVGGEYRIKPEGIVN